MKRSLLLTMVVVCFIHETSAQIRNVPADLPTIQAGIDAANEGDTVLVAEGTFFENINFKGKAITVASRFILDGDTSHISKTIIDGSQVVNPDTASTVMMFSGEDTTSVLMGFTITGGTGTIFNRNDQNPADRGGAGVFIMGSGGLITHNIIEANHLENQGNPGMMMGGGIYASVYHNHSVVIRKNTIRHNSATGENCSGGGIAAIGGRIVCEYNEITGNSAIAEVWVFGGGFMGMFLDAEGVIRQAIVRNNLISGNLASSESDAGGGGGYFQIYGFGEALTQVYNNVICNNHSTSFAGGLFFWDFARGRVFNNTIVDNTAADYCTNLAFVVPEKLSLYNNIIYSTQKSNLPEYWIVGNIASTLRVFNNLLQGPFQGEGVTAFDNTYYPPDFLDDSYQLAEKSPGIGWALDSFQFDSALYLAPDMDFSGNSRPDGVDGYADLGAYETPFARTDMSQKADLLSIGLWDKEVEPSFHKDTLHYLLCIPDTVELVPRLKAVPLVTGANLEADPATDLRSQDPADRTTTLHVTALDGTTRKTYTVEFYQKSTDALLSELSVSKGTMVPPFDPQVSLYTVCLPSGTTAPPGVSLVASHPEAFTDINTAKDITSTKTADRRTKVQVTSEYGGSFLKYYSIEFNVDRNPPKLSLVSDSIPVNDSIRVISTKIGTLFLLPGQGDADLDSLLAYMSDSTRAVMNDTVSLATEGLDPGIYWLYAVNQCASVSDAATVTVFDPYVNVGQRFIHGGVQVYPNPVKNLLTIETGEPGTIFIKITSLNGQRVYMDEIAGSPYRLDFSTFEKGIYLMTIRSNNLVTTRKLIKL